MYCPSCGKSIPDGSAFCLYCGKPTSAQVLPVGFSDQPPRYITEVGWTRDVPTKKNWRGQVHTGFRFWFALLDASRKPTRADGSIFLKLSKVNVMIILLTDFRTPVYQTTIQIHKDQFGPARGDPSFLGYWVNVEQAIVKENERHEFEMWLTTADGHKLYGTNRR
jgi:zinc-ribbon domain